MATSTPTISTDGGSMPRLAARNIPAMPKATAVKALAEKLVGKGFSATAAASLARAAVDPADVRRRLDRPAPIRVPGAVLWTVDADVWTPSVIPYIVNYREADGRVFPADETIPAVVAPKYPPIRRATGDPAGKPMLDLKVEGKEHLIHAVEASVGYLVEHNPLNDSIAEKGVMFPVTLVATSVETGNDGAIDIASTVDGSSRASSAMEVLNIEPEEVLGRFRTDLRELSSLIGRIRSIFDQPLDEVSDEDLGKANALILPARLIIGFEPDASGTADFAKAVHNYVGLIHGDLPPTPWPDTARIDAKADSVVAEFEQVDIITPNRARFFEGMFSPKEARRFKFPASADERGLMIATILSSKKSGVHSAIRAAVIQPSEKRRVTKGVKAEICAELALRSVRGILTPKDMSGARDVLANVYTNPAFWEQDLKPSGKAPEELLSEALEELKTGSGGPATAELGALGGFWLTARRLLREARFFLSENVRDGRLPSTVLSSLMDSEWGLRVLARSVADGRDGDVIWQVNADGNRVKGVTGEFLHATHDWIRGTVVPPPDAGDKDDASQQDKVVPVPERVLLDRRKRLEAAVQTVEQRHEDLRDVNGGDGEPLVDKRGLPPEITDDLRERLEAIRTRLVLYGTTWSTVSASANGAGAEDDEASS